MLEYILSSEYKYASAHEFELNMETTPLWLSAATKVGIRRLVVATSWRCRRSFVPKGLPDAIVL